MILRTATFAVVAAALALTACTPPASPPPPAEVPAPATPSPPSPPTPPPAAAVIARFVGEWTQKPETCGTGESDTRLRITADQLQFHESAGPVTAITVVSDDEILIHAAISGEGEGPNDATFRFRLSDGGETLTDVDQNFARKRCPTN